MTGLLFLATESVGSHLEFFSNLRYQTVGVLIVLTSLGGLAILVTIVGKTIEHRLAPASKTAPAPISASAAKGEIPPEIQAAIAAAVHVTVNSRARILEVTPVLDPRLSAWSIEGRRQIFHSHNVR